jgi:hypothetical protein
MAPAVQSLPLTLLFTALASPVSASPYVPVQRNVQIEAREGASSDPRSPADVIPIDMEFDLIDKVERFQRPNFFADALYQMWPSIYFDENNTSKRFPAIEGGPVLLHSGASQVDVDLNGDGEGEVGIRLTAKAVLTELDLMQGGYRRWAFLSTIGIQNENYQDIVVNLEPYEDQLVLYFLNAASVVGKIGKTKIRVLDDNVDGIYGSPPKAYAYVGLSAGQYQPDMDSMVIGKSKRAVPWSEFAKLDDQWYRLESASPGLKLKATPADIATGTLKLEFKGPPVKWMIVNGTGLLKDSYFDLAANGKGGIEVPVGTYTLFAGELSKGKKQQIMKSLILPGSPGQAWKVTEGEETVVKLGGPFGFEFETSKDTDTVTVIGRSVTIVGAAGERYERTWACPPRPEVCVRLTGTRKVSKAKKMPMVLDLYEENPDGSYRYTYADVWRPLDHTVKLKARNVETEVRLIEKKNKLFGKVESGWQ